MKRLLLNLLSILSLLLFLAAAALWVRSHFASDTLVWCPLSRSSDGFVSTEYLLDSRRGALHVGAIRHPYNKAEMPAVLYNVALAEHARQSFAAADRRWHSREPDDRSDWGFSGWTLKQSGPGGRSIGVGWGTPYWFLLLLFSLPPGLHFVLSRRRSRRRRQLGLCPRCGYDLRATPGRCPECGDAVAPQNA